MRWRDPATSAARPGVPRPVRAAAPVAVLLVVLAEEVAFAGQPTSADTATIAAYYGGHVAGVVWGNVLWIAAALLLLVAVRRATLRAAWWGPSPWLLSLAAATAMGLTSAAALLLAATAPGTPGGVVRWWEAEGVLFEVGTWAWLLVLLSLGVGDVRRGRRLGWLGIVVAVVAAVDLVDARWWCVLGGLALLTAAAPVPEDASTAISPEPVRDVLDTRRP